MKGDVSSRRPFEVNNGGNLMSPLADGAMDERGRSVDGSGLEFLLDCDFDETETSGERDGSGPPVTEGGPPLSPSPSMSLSLSVSSNFRRRLVVLLLRLTV